MKNLDLQKLIFENYLYIVSGLVLGVIIVGSYKYYNFKTEEKSAKAGDLYEILSNTSDDEEIYNISEKIRYEVLGTKMLKGISRNLKNNYSFKILNKKKDHIKSKEDVEISEAFE